MNAIPQKSPPPDQVRGRCLLPPRRPLCRRCDDTGMVGLDACADCTRNAEMRWAGARGAVLATLETLQRQEKETASG